MKTRITNSNLILILAAAGTIFFASCASMKTGNSVALLSAAGFQAHSPQTAKQKELYAALSSNKVECCKAKGKVLYVFKDEKAGVAYVGGEREHQRYQQLCMQKHVAQAAEENMSHPFAMSWSNQWGPSGW